MQCGVAGSIMSCSLHASCPSSAACCVRAPTCINQVPPFSLQRALITRQIGPPPPAGATPALLLQYASLLRIRLRSHHVDVANNLVESLAFLIIKASMQGHIGRADSRRRHKAMPACKTPFTVACCIGPSTCVVCMCWDGYDGPHTDRRCLP